jgi:hypothetical protein
MPPERRKTLNTCHAKNGGYPNIKGVTRLLAMLPMNTNATKTSGTAIFIGLLSHLPSDRNSVAHNPHYCARIALVRNSLASIAPNSGRDHF